MIRPLADLWHGRLPLGRAFWEFAILYGLLVNLLATVVSLAAFAAGLPDAIGLALFFMPAPYFLATTVGVWRSADAYPGPAGRAQAARVASLVWALVMLAT